MLAISILVLMGLVVMAAVPETPFARSLRRWLVEAPARFLNRTNVWRTLFYSGLIAAGIAMTLLFETEGAIVYGFMAPEVFAWALLFDVGVMIDALLIAAAILASNGLKVGRAQAAALAGRAVGLIRRAGSARSRRTRPPSRPVRKSSDDERPRWGGQPGYLVFSMA